MTTKELKSYIDRILGNNVRCLLPSYWWKRMFSLTLDKVDEKLDAANIKTINGESVIGEGNLKVGITTVSSMEELNALEAKIGYVATVASEYSTVNVEDCYLPNGENIVAEWDKLTPIRKVEVLGYDGSNMCQILLSAKVNDFGDCISAAYDAYNNNYVYSKGSVVDQTSTELSKSEFDALLLERDYRYAASLIQGELTVDSVFTLYTDSSTADAYIKGDTWTRLLKEGEGGTSVEEIYIGETEPTDKNVKVWINPNEQGESAGNGGSEFGVPNILFYYSIGTLSDERKEHNAKVFQQYFALLGKAQVLVMDDVLNTVAPGFGLLMDETSMILGVLDAQLPESGNRTNLEGVYYLLTSDGEVVPLDLDSV